MKIFIKFIAKLYSRNINGLEKIIGYKLTFPDLSEDWINGCVRVDLTKAWKKFGLSVTGVDYFTMGKVSNGTSMRFDPQAKQYQSWLGGYLIKFSKTKNLTIQDHFNLAVVDQLDWLRDYGDPGPFCKLDSRDFQEIEQIVVGGYKGKLYAGGGFSHSDVGRECKGFRFNFVTTFLANLFNLSNPALCLVGNNFVPKNIVNSCSTIYLKGFIIVLDIEKDVQAVLYGNGAVYEDENGKKTDTFDSLKDELMSNLAKTVVVRC